MNSTILLVDDEPMVLDLLYQIMDRFAQDYELLAAHNGMTALALLAQRSVALVITDMRMPDMDGLTLAEAIKARTPQCPIILMTGYPSPEVKQRADAAGVEYFLRKPFGLDQLATLVRTALSL